MLQQRMRVRFPKDETRAAAMQVALTTRILSSRPGKEIPYKPKKEDEAKRVDRIRSRARAYLGMSLVEIAAECIGYTGRFMSGSQRAGEILTRAFESTSDFPFVFENVLNKSLLARYELHAPTYRNIADERPFRDFRPHPQIRVGEFPAPQPVSETGELQYGSSADVGTNVSVVPYGVVFPVSRQMLVNDELGAIDQLLANAGTIVSAFENTAFFDMLLANPTYTGDSTPIFATAHNNIVESGSGAAPSISTIGTARAAIRQQKTPGGYYLGYQPSILLTGPLMETAGAQMVKAITPTLTTSLNPFEGQLKHVSDPNIGGTSWYLMIDPTELPCFMFGMLEGQDGPRIRVHSPFGVQGLQISLETDFGSGGLDFRGVYLNAGS